MAPFGTVEEKFYDLHFDANVKGMFFTVQKALPLMNDGGIDHSARDRSPT